jgi:transglutaminase-like putative cysteine protease
MFKLEEGWLTVLLLCAMMVVAAGGVAAAGWTDGLNAAWITGLAAIFTGLALARSRFSGTTAFLFATVYGLFVVGFFVGLGLSGDWHARSLEMILRLNAFLYKILHGGTSRDPLPFPITISLIFWYMGLLGAWSVFRRGDVWAAVIPAGVGLLVNAYYYLGPARLDLYLAVYVLLALMFVARMNLLAREREWQSSRVMYSPDLRIDFLRAGLAVAVAGVLIGWAAPSLAASPQAATTWRQMTGSFSLVRESWMRMFAAVRGYGQAYSDFYSDTLTLAGPARLTNEPIMDVHVNSASPLPSEVQAASVLTAVPRYYWRAAAYSTYTEGRWQLGDVTLKEFDPGHPGMPAALYQERRQVSLAFTMHVAASSRLYVAPQMMWIDRGTTLEVTYSPQAGAAQDVAGVRAQQVLRRGETYQIVSSISVADADSLRASGTNYPAWVTASFLQLPAEVTQRTRDLAQQIVKQAGATTPYDQAQAITEWLRQNITYDQNIDAPPPSVEPVDYVLFTSHRGYCNYYASGEVVLLRSLGVPARLAVGFNQGQADAATSTFHVLEQNAHAWPEVFFPSYGWVEFEPTDSEAPLVRPIHPAASATGADNTQQPNDTLSNRDKENRAQPNDGNPATPLGQLSLLQAWAARIPWQALLIGAAATLFSAVLLGLLSIRAGVIGWENLGRPGRWLMRRRGMLVPSAIGLIYLQLERAARWLGLPSSESVTPYERAAAFGQMLPETRPAVDTITDEYVAERYSPRPADAEVAQRAWRGVRFKIWHDAIRAFLLDVLEEDPLPNQPK